MIYKKQAYYYSQNGFTMKINAKLIFFFFFFSIFSFFLICGCGSGSKEEIASTGRTQMTENLLENLKKIAIEKGYLFGHEDSPMYGAGWRGADDKSDIKEVTSDYPSLMGFDLGHLELGDDKNLDDVPFDSMRVQIVRQFERGGVVTISWHPNNPVSGGTAWVADSLKDVEGKTVEAILDGGEKHELFIQWLDKAADYINSLQTKEGVKVPIIFRPWHEHTGSWFWWGKDWCTAEQYKQLWKLTRDRFDKKKVNNVLWAFSPNIGSEEITSDFILDRYPGDEYIDVMGWDHYCFAEEGDSVGFKDFSTNLDKCLKVVCEVAKEHKKLPALTETGSEGIKYDEFWTKTLMPVLNKYPIAYMLVWRNAPQDKPGHFYAPYVGQASVSDFIKFYNDDKTLFLKDINAIYLNRKQ